MLIKNLVNEWYLPDLRSIITYSNSCITKIVASLPTNTSPSFGKSFKPNRGLTNDPFPHKWGHAAIYNCIICEQKFDKKADQDHQRVKHSKTNCNVTSPPKHTFGEHVKYCSRSKTSEEKSFSRSTCRLPFKKKYDMECHIRAKHGNGDFLHVRQTGLQLK